MVHVQRQSILKETNNGWENIVQSVQNSPHFEDYVLSYQWRKKDVEFNQANDSFITWIHVIHISKNAASNIIKMMWTEMMELIKMANRQ